MSVRAKVTTVVELNCASTWQDNVGAAQVRKQAIEDARRVLVQALTGTGATLLSFTVEAVLIPLPEEQP